MKNIVLTGFMGTGKSTIGRLLARRLGRTLIDSDKRIEQECGISIAEIFNVYGESYFRHVEKMVIARISRYSHVVLVTGGGVVLARENMIRLRRNGIIICLTASLETILERTGRRTTRPLLIGNDRRERVIKLLQEREHLYRQADYCIDTSSVSPPQVINEIMNFLRQGGYLRGRRQSEFK